MINSVYELHDSLSQERKQQFWDWLSGDQLHNKFTFRNIAGSGSALMSDTVDGGLVLTAAGGAGNSSQIDFNDIRHYSHNSSIFISISKNISTTSYFHFIGLNEIASSPANTRVAYVQDSTQSLQTLNSALNSTSTSTTTSLSLDQSYNVALLDLRASSIILSINGVIEATKTDNLPDVPMQPSYRQGARGATTRVGNVKYMEAYNV